MASDEFTNDLAVERHDRGPIEAEHELDEVEYADDGCEGCGSTPASDHESGMWLCARCARAYDDQLYPEGWL